MNSKNRLLTKYYLCALAGVVLLLDGLFGSKALSIGRWEQAALGAFLIALSVGLILLANHLRGRVIRGAPGHRGAATPVGRPRTASVAHAAGRPNDVERDARR